MIGIRKIGINTHIFGAGGGGAAYPAILDDGNTVGWFEDDEANFVKDGSDIVSQWTDLSGQNNHLLQGQPGKQPVWSSTGVLFNGTSDFLKATFTFEQPEFMYLVFKQKTWTSNDRIFDGPSATNSGMIYQVTSSPIIKSYAGSVQLASSDLALDTFGIVRCLFNGAGSRFTVNNNTPETGDSGSTDMGGITLAANQTGGNNWAHIEVKALVIRKSADSVADSDLIYDYLKKKL